ncbi:MAG TPA: DNA polymerase III subunit delta [Gemmatimonadaceae bacterium]|nr:DNA polymerase III subunit delta [Gemmatimonadaceae bacterium]
MAASRAEKELHKAIQRRSFAPAYYLHGDDEYLKDERARELADAVVDPATRDFNLDIRRGGVLDAESLASLVATPPMMAERRMVMVREVNALKKDARAALDRYLASPAPDVVVLLVAPAGVKSDAALAETTVAVEFAPLTGDRVPRWVVHHATTALSTTITSGAVDLLISAVGNDLPQLAAELDKLASYTNGAAIDEEAVGAVVGIRRGETLGDLLDRVLAHDAAGALVMIDQVLAQPKTTAVTIVMALTTQTLALAWARAARDRGFPAVGIERELFSLLKEGNAFPGRPWGEAVGAWSQAVSSWSSADLEAALDALLAADFALKESRLSSDEQVVASLVLTLCGTARRAAA